MTGWARRFGIGLACVLGTLGFGLAQAQTPPPPSLEFGDAPVVSTTEAWSQFSGLSSPTRSADPLVTNTAHALGDDVDRIFLFVHDQIEVVPLFGVQKGARGALIDKSGTPLDQTHLFVELLRAAGYEAQYVIGTVTLSQTQMTDWLGVSSATATTEVLADGGFPVDVNGGDSTFLHIWARANIGGTWYEFDPAIKRHTARPGGLTTTALDSAMGFSASSFMSSALHQASSSTGNAPEVAGFNGSNVRSNLQVYSQNLLTHIATNFPDGETADVIGGRDIMPYAEEVGLQTVYPLQDNIEGPRQATLASHSQLAIYANDIPTALRTQVQVAVASSAGADVFTWYLDEIYGQELAFIPLQVMPLPTQGPNTYQLYLNGQAYGLNHVGVGGTASIAFDHPYPASGGDYLDRTVNVSLSFFAGPVQIILGGGRMTPDFGAYMEARSSHEDSYVLYQTPQTQGEETEGIAPVGAQRATKRRNAASFAAQFGAAIGMTEELGEASIVLHDLVVTAETLPVIGGSGDTPKSSLGVLSVRGAFSANAHSGLASDTLAVRRATAALAGALEGSVTQQTLDSVFPVSTAARFDWFSGSDEHIADNRRFYWANQSNWDSYVSGQVLDDDFTGSSLLRTRADQYIDAGYTVIIPRSSDLGPGDETVLVCNEAQSSGCFIAGPERGGAFIALSSTGVAHVITAQGELLKGGGGTNDAETDPSRIFAIPDDFLERQFTARAEAHNVDMASGVLTYTPAPDMVVGEGAYPYSLSFQRTFRSNDVADRSAYESSPIKVFQERLGEGWTSNFMAEARMSNEGQRAFGESSPREATDTIAVIRVLLALSGDRPTDLETLQYQLGAIHALAWWSDQLSYNAITIVHGPDSRSYFRLADETFYAPGDPTQIVLSGQRTAGRNGYAAAYRWHYSGMCVRATAGDASVSYYGTWQQGFAACDTNAAGGRTWMRFRRQTFPQGSVVVEFDDTTLSNNLGRAISLNAVGGGQTGAQGMPADAQYTLVDESNQDRTVSITLGDGLRVTGTDGNLWSYDLSGGSSFRVFAPAAPTEPIATFTFAPNARGQVGTITDAVGNMARYWISTGRVGAVIDPDHYNPSCVPGPGANCNHIASRTHFDEHGQPVRVVNRLGYESRTSYDALRRVTRSIRPEGDYETYGYDDRHNRILTTRVAKPGSGLADIVTGAAYDTLCNMPLTATDARGNVTTYALVPNRCLISTATQPAVDDGTDEQPTLVPPMTTYTWNALGQLVTRTDPTGRVTTNAYNASTHYLDSVTAPGGALTQFGRNPQGDIVSVIDPRGYVHTGTYDLARRLTRYDGPSGTNAAARWTYNPDGLVTLIEQATGNASDPWAETIYTYWETGRVKTMTDADGGVTQYFYDALNRLDHVLDPVGRRSESEYDAEGQVLEERRGVGTADEIVYATRAWTANGLLDWVEDANHNRSNLDYDGFDRLSRLYMPLPTLGQQAHNSADYEEYGYDDNGNRTSVRLRSGETIRYRYDALNRQCFKDLPSVVSDPEDECGTEIASAGAADVFFGYDLAGRPVYVRFPGSFAYDIVCNTSFNGVDYCYDTPGRVSAETSYGRRLQFEYDASSNRTGVIYPTPTGAAALTANYDYDPLNRVTAVRENGAGSGVGVLASYEYDAQSRRTHLYRAGGAGRATHYEYSPASRLTRLDHGAIDGTNDADWSYAYTDAGQVQSRTLIAAYEWAVGALDEDYEVNGLNQYTEAEGATFGYDDRGNLTDSGARRYCYDVENRLTGVAPASTDPCANPLTMALEYDPLGRLRQTVGTATTQFLYDGDRLVAEYNSSGALQRRYVHGPGVDEPLVWYEGDNLNDRRWLITDRQGSVIAATDSSGALIGSVYRYGPYGEPDDINGWAGSRFRYTGQIALPEAGLYHYKARVYHPGLGRFLQTDPVGYQDDLNLYAYVRNDATNFTDPTGLSSSSDCGSRVNDRDAGASSCTAVGEITASKTISGQARGPAKRGGLGPIVDGAIGEAAAAIYYTGQGYEILDSQVSAELPRRNCLIFCVQGRRYDHVMQGPNSEDLIAVEAKATRIGVIRPVPSQIRFDARVMRGEPAIVRSGRLEGQSITDVYYYFYLIPAVRGAPAVLDTSQITAAFEAYGVHLVYASGRRR